MSGRGAHEEYDELAVGWALGALEPDDESRFGRHVGECERCRQTVDDAQDVTAALALALPVEAPSAALRARIMAAVTAEPRGAEPAPTPVRPFAAGAERALAPRRVDPAPVPIGRARSRHGRFGRQGVVRFAALAAALALIAGLGVWNVVLRSQQADDQATVAAQAAVLDELNDRGIYRVAPLRNDNGNNVGMVVVHGGTAQVMADGLPLNDRAAETFVLWGLGPAGAPEPLGTFDVTTRELDVRTVSSTVTGLDQYDGFAISLEPGRRAPSTPTEMVATGTVGS